MTINKINKKWQTIDVLIVQRREFTRLYKPFSNIGLKCY